MQQVLRFLSFMFLTFDQVVPAQTRHEEAGNAVAHEWLDRASHQIVNNLVSILGPWNPAPPPRPRSPASNPTAMARNGTTTNPALGRGWSSQLSPGSDVGLVPESLKENHGKPQYPGVDHVDHHIPDV